MKIENDRIQGNFNKFDIKILKFYSAKLHMFKFENSDKFTKEIEVK